MGAAASAIQSYDEGIHCLSFQKPTIFAEWILIIQKLIWTKDK